MSKIYRYIPHFILLLIISTLSGCELFGTKEIEKGTFYATIEGDINTTLYGVAEVQTSGTFSGDLASQFILIDKLNEEQKFKSINFPNIPSLQTGIYQVGNFEEANNFDTSKVYSIYTDSNSHDRYLSTEGTFEITLSDENYFKGNFKIFLYSLIHIEDEDYKRVQSTMSGSFYSEKGRLGEILD